MNHGLIPWECRYRIPGAQFVPSRNMIERSETTFKKFANTPGWRNASEEELTNDFFSINNETNLLLNPSYYEEKNGRLFDPVRKRNVAGTGGGDGVEENVITQLEDWFLSHDSGIAIWISPRGNGTRPYPEEQLTIYRIGYKFGSLQKVLFLTSHQFKHEFKNPEAIRKFIFPEVDNEESVIEILNWLKSISDKKVETSLQNVEERKSQARYYAQQYKSGVSIDRIIYEMTQTEFLGQNPIGCGAGGNSNISGGFGYTETTTQFFGYEDQYGPLNFNCPHCHATNTRPPGQLISNCQFCGADVRC